MSLRPNILFLCLGNICRSPLASLALSKEAPDFRVLSRGLEAWNIGKPAHPWTVAVAEADYGLDLSAHRAAQVSDRDFAWADIVLIPDRRVLETLREVASPLPRVGLMAATEIFDPYGGAWSDFVESARTVIQASHSIADWLLDAERSGFRNIATTGPSPVFPG